MAKHNMYQNYFLQWSALNYVEPKNGNTFFWGGMVIFRG